MLRTVDPPLADARRASASSGLRRLGKRIVFELEGDLFLVLHLMIAGRLHWKTRGAQGREASSALAAFDFANGTLLLTEASTKKRASLHVVRGAAASRDFDRGRPRGRSTRDLAAVRAPR